MLRCDLYVIEKNKKGSYVVFPRVINPSDIIYSLVMFLHCFDLVIALLLDF